MGPDFRRAQPVRQLCPTMSGPQLGDSLAVGWEHLAAWPLTRPEPGLGCCAAPTAAASLCGSASSEHGGFKVTRIFTWQFLALRACVLENMVEAAFPLRVQPLKSRESNLPGLLGKEIQGPYMFQVMGHRPYPFMGAASKNFGAMFQNHPTFFPSFISEVHLPFQLGVLFFSGLRPSAGWQGRGEE